MRGIHVALVAGLFIAACSPTPPASTPADASVADGSEDTPAADVPAMDVPAADVPVSDVPAMDAPSCPAGRTRCGATCEDITTANLHCGACGNACAAGQVCGGGICGTTCASDAVRCGDRCANTQTDPTACGGCDTVCPGGANATPTCAAGRCGVACDPGWADCDGDAADGCEVDLSRSPAHCGRCGARCADGEVCSAGVCRSACAAPTTRCDGICVDPTTDAAHCGGCNMACAPRPHAIATCVAGVCGSACAPGWADCDGSAANGCEARLASSAGNCGACGNACAAGMYCSLGACGSSCRAPTTLCAGACADLATDAANCGSCGHACNTQEACAAGRCVPTCSGATPTACGATCVDLQTDERHCGGCDRPCGTGLVCGAGACRCADSLSLCGGACVDTATSDAHCGGCGHPCAGATHCAGGACRCTGELTACGGACLDTRADPANCGSCGNACPARANATATCSNSACGFTCGAGYADCNRNPADGCETAPVNDAANCGSCGQACGAGMFCSGGTCRSSCATGELLCAGRCATTASDPANCGSCGNACPARANATATCSNSACGFTCNAGYGDCDGNAANGCETATASSASNCGSCGNACPARANATATCSNSACGFTCTGAQRDCDGNAANGCELNVSGDPNNCGGCRNVCPTPPNAIAACSSGTCDLRCLTSRGNCDGDVANGCEVDLLTSASHCGGCGNACPSGYVCNSGTCTLRVLCLSPQTNCSGACVNTQTDASNCGSCNNACPARANASATCSGGGCGFACNSGWADCNGYADDGCEAQLGTTSYCASCTNSCGSASNGTPACINNMCTLVCTSPLAQCDNNWVNGCEDTRIDANNCGTCGHVCPGAPHASGSCSGGGCSLVCNSGWSDCDGNMSNGCEVDLSSNASHCGACNAACPSGYVCGAGVCTFRLICLSPQTNCSGTCVNTQTSTSNCGSCNNACPARANASTTCSGGGCGFACNSGWADCNGYADDGCEAQLGTTSYCASCTNSCGSTSNGTPACINNMCTLVCTSPLAQCDNNWVNGCEDPRSDANHCGTCGHVCPNYPNGSATCSNGSCNWNCNTGRANCNGDTADGCEVDVNFNASNCGSCGHACPSGFRCVGGNCAPEPCTFPNAMCGGQCVSTWSNLSHCGGCNILCSSNNASPTCTTGTCSLTCAANYGNCNGDTTDGCETPLTSTSNCGSCGNVCPTFPNSVTRCTPPTGIGSYSCRATCAPGYANCDGNTGNGCEVDTGTSTSNCGGCGVVCGTANTTAVSCSGGACSLTCASGYANCDGNAANGCETALHTTQNCNSCGDACGAGFSRCIRLLMAGWTCAL